MRRKDKAVEFRNISAVIFDMDGVIIDSEPLHFAAHKQALEAFGYDLSREDYEKHIRSRGRHHGYPIIFGPDINVEAVAKVKDQIYRDLVAASPLVFEDTLQLFKKLEEKNIPMAIGTSSSDGRHIISGLGLSKYFDLILTAKDVFSNKPNPEIYLKCMEHMKVKSNRVLIIEDSSSGVQAGVSSGATVIYLVRPGDQADEKLRHHDKVFMVKSLNEIIISP